MKRYLGLFLALVLLLVGLAAVASAEEVYNLIWEGDGYYLADASTGKIVEFTGWKQATVEEYWGDDESYTYSGWFYGEAKGKLAQGWKEIGGKWYYLYPVMCTGSYYDYEKGIVYLMDKSGAWTGVSSNGKGWIKQNNKWYYIVDEGDWKWFYTNGNERIDDKNYFFKDGVMQDNGWVSQTDTWQGETYVSWVYANPNGDLATGWKKIDGKWYYFSDWGWMYQGSGEGLFYIDDKLYAFDKSGAMLENQWYAAWSWTYEGETYTDWYYMGADGTPKTGWFKDGNDWYYADEWGWMWYDMFIEYNGAEYYLTKSGAMATGWELIGGDWFYFKASGAMAEKEWIQDGGAWYYLGEYGAMYADGTYTIDGKEYKFDASGKWIP